MGQQHVDNAIVNNAIRIFNLAKDEWTTYYVDKNGVHGQVGDDDKFNGLSWQTPFATIQHALDTGEAGAKIYFADGTYAETLNMSNAHVKLIGDTREGAIIAPTAAQVTDYVVHITGDQCEISRCKIVYPTGATGMAALYLESFKNRIDNVWLHNTDNVAWGVLTVTGSDEQHVTNCKFTGFMNQMNIDGGDYHKIHDNIMTLNGAWGFNIFITHTSKCEVYENELDGGGAGTGLDSDGNTKNVYYHNNFLNHAARNTTAEADANNCWIQNYYDDATADLNHDGIGDTPYAIGVPAADYDYEPIVKYNGWKHLSPGSSAIGYLFDRAYYGVVTTYISTTQFAATALAGFGDAFFKGWYVAVLYNADSAGSAPQTESQPISAYTSATGTFTHTAFTAPLAAGDKVLIIHSSTSSALIADTVWDEATAAHVTAATFGKAINTLLADTAKIGASYTDGMDVPGATSTVRGHLQLLQEETEWTKVDDYSDYNDSTVSRIKINKEYPILEVIQSAGTITVYKYLWDDGDAGADPSETQARTTVTAIDGSMFELTRIVLSLYCWGSGIWERMGATDKLYIYAKYYSGVNSAFELVQPVVLRDKAVDTLISSPPVDTDLGEVVVIDPTLMPTVYKFIVYMRNTANIATRVWVPFYFGVRRKL